MTATTAKRLDRESCLRALAQFWRAETRVEEGRDGLVVAMPLLYPDGWQVVVDIEPLSAREARLSDKGRTLGKLAEMGLNWERTAKRNEALLEERLKAFELQRDGFEIASRARLPLQGMDVHLFGEALVSLAHLAYRIEASQPVQSVANAAVRQMLDARKAEFRERATVNGRLERGIQIDFLVQGCGSMAIEVVKRQTQLLPHMEQWGWRWMDIRDENPNMLRAMVFDPDRQEWDDTSLSIGRSVCHVFCPYHEVEALDNALRRVA